MPVCLNNITMSNLIIGNLGFDVPAMAALSEKDFIDLHKDNDVLNYGKTPAQVQKWLKEAYVKIKSAAGKQEKEPEKEITPAN